MAGTFDGASSGSLAVSSVSAHVVDSASGEKMELFLGMKHEAGELGSDGVWHYKTSELQEKLVRV